MRLGHASGFQATLPSRPCCLPSRDASVVTRSSPWGVDELWGHLGRARADAWESALATASGLRVCSHVLSGRRHSEGAYRSEVRAAAEHRHVGQSECEDRPADTGFHVALSRPCLSSTPGSSRVGRTGSLSPTYPLLEWTPRAHLDCTQGTLLVSAVRSPLPAATRVPNSMISSIKKKEDCFKPPQSVPLGHALRISLSLCRSGF